MSVLKSAYVAAARKSMDMPFVASYFDRAAESGSDFQRWVASLTAIYQLDRMIRLDIPWWNVAATDEIEAFLKERPKARVFEYGSGASSAWLARRCGELISVEHDEEWRSGLVDLLGDFPHCRIDYRPLDSEDGPTYTQAIAEAGGTFDMIVVDGRLRTACLEAAISHLKPDGLILFDDSGRQRYRGAIETSGLEETHHHGRSYCVPYPDHSSILRRPAALN